MRKIIILIVLTAFLLSGCGSWLDGEYHSVRPHASDGITLPDDVVTVSDYIQLRDALVEMVTSGQLESTFYITGFELSEADQHMSAAINHVKQSSAVGSYAVDEIRYESGTSGGAAAIAIHVTYLHGRQEILRIKNANNMDAVKSLIGQAIKDCDPSVVIKVDKYKALDTELFVQEYAFQNPDLCMELPQVTTNVYPQYGDERVIELSFTYTTARDTLKNMQSTVSPIFAAAELYVHSSENEMQKYEQLYAFLMERFDYTVETSITPAYSLLRYGVGDSRAFALVFNKICQNADLDCQVISGTRDGAAHYWNRIRIENVEYHLDLLASNEKGEFTVMLPEEMAGYVWDYSADV